VIDLDLEKFFDRVNHDKLMGRIAKRIEDKRLLKLVRAFLNAGVMENGLVSPSVEGTPQGGPLSPLLSNLVLDELDRELERRGHRFVRYADDRPWSLAHRPEQSPLCGALQCLLFARSPILGRHALAQLLEPPYTDPYVRWCGRGGAERLPPIPILGTKRTFYACRRMSVLRVTAVMQRTSPQRPISTQSGHSTRKLIFRSERRFTRPMRSLQSPIRVANLLGRVHAHAWRPITLAQPTQEMRL
jgi:hypothetical protein